MRRSPRMSAHVQLCAQHTYADLRVVSRRRSPRILHHTEWGAHTAQGERERERAAISRLWYTLGFHEEKICLPREFLCITFVRSGTTSVLHRHERKHTQIHIRTWDSLRMHSAIHLCSAF